MGSLGFEVSCTTRNLLWLQLALWLQRGCGFPTVCCHSDLSPTGIAPNSPKETSQMTTGSCGFLGKLGILDFCAISERALSGVITPCALSAPTIQGYSMVTMLDSHCSLNTSCPSVAGCLHLCREGCWPCPLLSATCRNGTTLPSSAQTPRLRLNEPFLPLFLHYPHCSCEAVTPSGVHCRHVSVFASPRGL